MDIDQMRKKITNGEARVVCTIDICSLIQKNHAIKGMFEENRFFLFHIA
jgi:hypothetical protein